MFLQLLNFAIYDPRKYKIKIPISALQDTMPDCKIDDETCDPYLIWASPIFFTSFVITVQFVLVNLVVAVIMQALDDSRKVKLPIMNKYKL